MKNAILLMTLFFGMVSCGPKEPEPIKLNSDSCAFCKMTIASAPYASELITDKGRVYKFDDLSCMIKYAKENGDLPNAKLYVTDYLNANTFVGVESAFLLQGGIIRGPMGGQVVGFKSKADAQNYQSKLQAESVDWTTLYKSM